MSISETIIKTIKKIALDKSKSEDDVTWQEIAVEQAVELENLKNNKL